MLPKLAHPNWSDCKAFDRLPNIAAQLKPGTYYPEPSINTFRAFEMNPLDIKVVMMGMSPYPNVEKFTRKPNAIGYAFATPPVTSSAMLSPSLKVIYRDILDFETGYLDPSLKLWRDQGVFLLNAALTCLKESPESHMKLWSKFTEELVEYISDLPGGQIWYFLGDDAKYYSRFLAPFKNITISSMHPARAARTGEQFDGAFLAVKNAYRSRYNLELKYLC